MKPLHIGRRRIAKLSYRDGAQLSTIRRSFARTTLTISEQQASVYSSVRNLGQDSSVGEELPSGTYNVNRQAAKDINENTATAGILKKKKKKQVGIIPDGHFIYPTIGDPSTGVPLIRRVVVTNEEVPLEIPQYGAGQTVEEALSKRYSAGGWRGEAHDHPSLRAKYEMSKNLDQCEFDLNRRWVKRLQIQLNPVVQVGNEREQSRKLLTRRERRDVLALSSGLQEGLDFARTIKQKPWTRQDLSPASSKNDDSVGKASHRSAAMPAMDDVKFEFDEIAIKDYLNSIDEDEESDTLFSFTAGRSVSITSILAGFIDLNVRKPVLSAEQYDQLLLELFSDEALTVFKNRGDYTVEDVVTWAWVLDAESPYAAAIRLLVWTNRPQSEKRVPRVILHQILKRNPLEPATIQLLATHLNHRIANTIDPKWASVYTRFATKDINVVTAEEAQILHNPRGRYVKLVRWKRAVCILILMKHAATVLPMLLPNLASMLCKHVHTDRISVDGYQRILGTKVQRSYNAVFNKAIELSARTPTDPFLNVAFQEKAQFILIRHMSTFRPRLTLSLESYRAIVSVQLRHRKTMKERLWTELKSRAWPPYREDKLGIDALKKEKDYGISRAQRAIMNMKEAGYGSTDWEDSASILSGWDVNRSPTVQSRRVIAVHARPKSVGELAAPRTSLWQSRVLSTRTIEEAWAIFSDYIEEDVPKHPAVFCAMFEKIIFERKRNRSLELGQDMSGSRVLAGDALEAVGSSRNPREQTYVATPPPSFEMFYIRYLTYFPVLNTETLCFLLPHADSLAQAYDFVERSDLSAIQKNVLFNNTKIGPDRIPISTKVLSAFVRILSNFATSPLPNHHKVSALSHALNIVTIWDPKTRSPWQSLLQAMDQKTNDSSTRTHWLQQWSILLDILQRMEKREVYRDSAIFHTVCSVSTRLARFASQVSARGHYHEHNHGTDLASEMRLRTGKIVKQMFKRMVSVDLRTTLPELETDAPFLSLNEGDVASDLGADAQFDLSGVLRHILYTPSPAALHLFVRLLAMTEDRKAIFDLVRWMAIYHQELAARAAELANGARQFRFTLIAIRVALESSSVPFVSMRMTVDLNGSDQAYAEETKKVVESVVDWRGWPSDEEVNDYMRSWVHVPQATHDEYDEGSASLDS